MHLLAAEYLVTALVPSETACLANSVKTQILKLFLSSSEDRALQGKIRNVVGGNIKEQSLKIFLANKFLSSY